MLGVFRVQKRTACLGCLFGRFPGSSGLNGWEGGLWHDWQKESIEEVATEEGNVGEGMRGGDGYGRY